MNNDQMAIEYYKTAALQTANYCPKPKYIPKIISLPRTVRGLSLLGEPRVIAKPGEYDAYVNPLGAVSVNVCTDGGEILLGLMLNEFEVIEWQANPHAC